jgi:hypothetical protein
VLRQEFGPQIGAVPIRANVVAGEAAAGLARAAADADLLVVGRSRHRWHLLRRSIGDRCAQIFEGPVVLVPAERKAGGGDIDLGAVSVRQAGAPDARPTLAERP